MRKLLIALAAVVLLAGGWWFASPYWTLHQMQAAAKRGDTQALSAYIDYPAVRANLKSEVRRTMMNDASANPDPNPIAALGAAAATVMVDPLIDALVTPQGLQAAFASGAGRQGALLNGKSSKLPQVPERPVVQHESFDRFTAHERDRSKGSLLFARHGLGWRLVGFELPGAS